MHGKECLRWKDAIEGQNGLPGVDINEIHYKYWDDEAKRAKDYSYMKPHLRQWRDEYFQRDNLSDLERKELLTDYEYKFCRRLGDSPETNNAVCLGLGPRGEDALDEI